MFCFFITLCLLVNIGLIQSADPKPEFVDIRSTYYISDEAANREKAVELCKNDSAWLACLDHAQELLDVGDYFQNMPLPASGDPVRIQVSGTRSGKKFTERIFYYWNYHFKPSKLYTIPLPKWCVVHNTIKFPLDYQYTDCLMISMDTDRKWCYKNYDCAEELPFMCERKLTNQPPGVVASKPKVT